MGMYSGVRRSITPNTSNDNWTLLAGNSESAKVKEVYFGGEADTSAGMCTRIARSSGGTEETTATPAKLHPHTPANLISFITSWGSVQPTLDSSDLFATSWNAHGGVVRWLADHDEEIWMIGQAEISCRNSVGTGTSSYGVIWQEP